MGKKKNGSWSKHTLNTNCWLQLICKKWGFSMVFRGKSTFNCNPKNPSPLLKPVIKMPLKPLQKDSREIRLPPWIFLRNEVCTQGSRELPASLGCSRVTRAGKIWSFFSLFLKFFLPVLCGWILQGSSSVTWQQQIPYPPSFPHSLSLILFGKLPLESPPAHPTNELTILPAAASNWE